MKAFFNVIDEMLASKEKLNHEYIRIRSEVKAALSQYSSSENTEDFSYADEYEKLRIKKLSSDEKVLKAKKDFEEKYENYVVLFDKMVLDFSTCTTKEERQEQWENIKQFNDYLLNKYL